MREKSSLRPFWMDDAVFRPRDRCRSELVVRNVSSTFCVKSRHRVDRSQVWDNFRTIQFRVEGLLEAGDERCERLRPRSLAVQVRPPVRAELTAAAGSAKTIVQAAFRVVLVRDAVLLQLARREVSGCVKENGMR